MPKAISTDFITLRGKTNFAKVLGKPVENYDKDGNEWKLDFIITNPKEDLPRLKKLGIANKVKQREDYLDGVPHLTLRHAEYQKGLDENGKRIKNDPPAVVDVTGAAWDQNKLLGNGTVIDLKMRVANYGKGFHKGIYIAGIRVLELVPYNRTVFDDMDEDDPYNPKNRAKQDASEDFDADEDENGEEQVETNADDADEDDDVPF